jgi:hypothetical protein
LFHQDLPLKSYPVDPVDPVQIDICSDFDSCRLLREIV